jgi:hypothetical protein
MLDTPQGEAALVVRADLAYPPSTRHSCRQLKRRESALSTGSGLPYASITRYLFYFGSGVESGNAVPKGSRQLDLQLRKLFVLASQLNLLCCFEARR